LNRAAKLYTGRQGSEGGNSKMARVETFTTSAAIARLAPEWKALWERVPDARPFQSPEWLSSWWDHFGNSAPLVLTARDGDELIGMLALYRLDEVGRRKLLPIGISLSDYIDALIDPDYPKLAHTLLTAILNQQGWDECYVPDLPPSAALLSAAPPISLQADRGDGETCPVLLLPNAVEGLREVVPRKTLRDLRQARCRAAAVGTVTVVRADANNARAFIDELFRLHELRWRQRAERGVCADPVVRGFHLAASGQMLSAGIARVYLLQIGGSIAAAYYGFVAKGIAHAYLSGFDPDYAELSPGTQIVAHAIEEAVREGAREFHFLRGGEAYKYAWGAIDRPNTALTLRRRC
jgi:CelD/BcsL family acetyltransferase involved in cellulose biosynthesis